MWIYYVKIKISGQKHALLMWQAPTPALFEITSCLPHTFLRHRHPPHLFPFPSDNPDDKKEIQFYPPLKRRDH